MININVIDAVSPYVFPGFSAGTRIKGMKVDLTPDIIEKATTQYLNVTIEEARSKKRERGIVECRQIIMYLLRKHTTLSLKSVGERIGRRDHTTVIHSVQHIRDMMKTELSVQIKISDIEHFLLN